MGDRVFSGEIGKGSWLIEPPLSNQLTQGKGQKWQGPDPAGGTDQGRSPDTCDR